MTEADLTIEQLAQQTGMTVRNIRAHQTRGLLPPPHVKGRTGFYGPEHRARLEFIREMQGAGFNLNAIKHLLDATPTGSGEELLRFERLLMAPWGEEQAEVVSAAELAERFGVLDPKSQKRAEAMGIICDIGGGNFEVPSPALLRAGEEVIALGIPLDHALSMMEKVHRHAQGVSREFVRLFISDVWRPFKAAGLPEDQLPAIREALERLRSLASDVLLSLFRLRMSDEVESAFENEIKKPLPKAGKR